MCEEDSEPFADQPRSDVVVAVAIRSERRFRIVRMQCAQSIKADAGVEVLEQNIHYGRICDVDARNEEMTRVEANTEALVPPECSEDRGELVDRAADRPAGTRGVLHQDPCSVVAAVEQLFQRRDYSREAGLEAGAEMGAEVEDHRVG